MELGFDNQIDNKYDYLEERYLHIATVGLAYLGIKRNYEIDVSLVDRDSIQEINRTYRKIDKVTDVISFAFDDDKENVINESDEIPHMLGEIFICIDRALEQAKEIGNTDDRELRFLFTHGLLHLLGYDHMKKEDEIIMFDLQEKILIEEEKQWKIKN